MRKFEEMFKDISQETLAQALCEIRSFETTGILKDGVVRDKINEVALEYGTSTSMWITGVQNEYLRIAAYRWLLDY